MRFMILLKADWSMTPGSPLGAEVLEHLDRYNDSLAKAGVLLAADGLCPLSDGVRMTFADDRKQFAPGDQTETAASFWVLQVRSEEEAVEWMKRLPTPPGSRGVIELRRAVDSVDPKWGGS